MESVYGIVAGCGIYPAILADRLAARGHRVAVAGIRGHFSGLPPDGRLAVAEFPLGAIRAKARFFRAHGATRIFFAGGVRRRGAFWSARPDRYGLGLLFRAVARGDDRLLRSAAARFGALGLVVEDPSPVLGDLFAREGLLAGPLPDPGIRGDLEIAWQGAVSLGLRDRGQAAVAHRGRIIGLEDRRGTDALLDRVKRPGAVLAKAVKPNQDPRFDRPAVGPITAEKVGRAGLSAIGLQAGGVLILDPDRFLETCDRHGVSVVGISPRTGKKDPAEVNN